jgi:hypothetical protein
VYFVIAFNTGHPEKVVICRLVKKLRAFYETPRFGVVFVTTHHWTFTTEPSEQKRNELWNTHLILWRIYPVVQYHGMKYIMKLQSAALYEVLSCQVPTARVRACACACVCARVCARACVCDPHVSKRADGL